LFTPVEGESQEGFSLWRSQNIISRGQHAAGQEPQKETWEKSLNGVTGRDLGNGAIVGTGGKSGFGGANMMSSDGGQSACPSREKLWLDYINSVVDVFSFGRSLPVGPSPISSCNRPPSIRSNRQVLICSPHPDDEALVGALPLRLRLESGVEVTNCAITLGHHESRRPRRLSELRASCSVLGFQLIVLRSPDGFESVTPEDRHCRNQDWSRKAQELAEIFDTLQPDLVLFPHRYDFHKTHIGTHLLVLDALRYHSDRNPGRFVLTAQSEYWHPMSNPNLMLEVAPEHVALLAMATAEHGGEVSRNPYHVLYPARLIDNVRRGSEVVGGEGAVVASMQFAELYRVLPMTATFDGGHRTDNIIVKSESQLSIDALREKFGLRANGVTPLE
jgi:N-acetylglucosamine malate deacetylase 1